jgi:hypothetical protein
VRAPPGNRTRNHPLRRRPRCPVAPATLGPPGRVRTCDHRIKSPLRYPLRHGGVSSAGGDRTRVLRFMRPLLATGSATALWLATAESNRAIPPYQGGPVDQLGRGQRNAEVSSPRGLKAAHGLLRAVPAPAGCIPCAETGIRTRKALPLGGFRDRCRRHSACLSMADGAGVEPAQD